MESSADAGGDRILATRVDTTNGTSIVRLNKKWGFVDISGQLVITPQFSKFSRFHEGLAEMSENTRWGFIDRSGKVAIGFEFAKAYPFSEGLACIEANAKYGFIDKGGSTRIPPIFDDARGFSEGLAAVKLDRAWGYVDPSGELVGRQLVCELEAVFKFGRDHSIRRAAEPWGHDGSLRDGKSAPSFFSHVRGSEK
jgi:WG containing repeat